MLVLEADFNLPVPSSKIWCILSMFFLSTPSMLPHPKLPLNWPHLGLIMAINRREPGGGNMGYSLNI